VLLRHLLVKGCPRRQSPEGKDERGENERRENYRGKSVVSNKGSRSKSKHPEKMDGAGQTLQSTSILRGGILCY